MTRRSTLVLLTCIGALSVPAIQTSSAASPFFSSRVLLAQANPTGNSFQPLGIGSQGVAVVSLQQRLSDADYYDGPVDGRYGLETQRAVVALQRSAGLEDTGTLNEATWQALESGTESTFEFNQSDSNKPDSNKPDSNKPDSNGSSIDETGSGESGNGESDIAAIADNAPENNLTDITPVEAEMPPADADLEPVLIENEVSEGTRPALLLGLGAIALLGSFGVGFYMANKGKSANVNEADDPHAVGIDIETTPALPVTSNVPPVPTNPALQTGVRMNNQTPQPMASGAIARERISKAGPSSHSPAEDYRQPKLDQMGYPGGAQVGQQIGTAGPLSQLDVIEGLLGELHNPDPAKRRKAIWELGQRGNSVAVQPLVDAMPNADSKEKSLLLAALSEIGIRSLKPMNRAMAIAFQDQNPEVRKNAIRDLSRVYDLVVQISHMLGHAAEDDDPEVRQTAAWALEKLNHTRKAKEVDTNMRSFSGGGTTPIDMLSSEASIRRSQEFR